MVIHGYYGDYDHVWHQPQEAIYQIPCEIPTLVLVHAPCGGDSRDKNNQHPSKRRADIHSTGSMYADNIVSTET